MASISVRSNTTTRASAWDVTASRNLKAASLRTNLPSHSTTAISPTLSICTFGIISSQLLLPVLRARTMPSISRLYFVQDESAHSLGKLEVRAAGEQICATDKTVVERSCTIKSE